MSTIMKLMYSPLACIAVICITIASLAGAVPWTASTDQISVLEKKVARLEQQVALNDVAIDRIVNGPDAVKVLGHGVAHPFKVGYAWAKTKSSDAWAKTKSWFKRDGAQAVSNIAVIPGLAPAKK